MVEKAAVVESTPTGTEVTVGGAAGVVKDDQVVARSGVIIHQVVINNVKFAFDSAELTPDFRNALDAASDALKPRRSSRPSATVKWNRWPATTPRKAVPRTGAWF